MKNNKKHLRTCISFLACITICIIAVTGCNCPSSDNTPGSANSVCEKAKGSISGETESPSEQEATETEKPSGPEHVEFDECKALKEITAQKPELVIQEDHNQFNDAIAFSADSRYLAAGGLGGDVQLYYAETLEYVKEFPMQRGRLRALHFDQSGEYLTVSYTGQPGDKDGLIKVWSVKSGEVPGEKHYEGNVWALAINPDSSLLASVGSDQAITLWSFPELKLIKKIQTDKYPSSVFFTPDGKMVVTGSVNGFIDYWAVEELEHIKGYDLGDYVISDYDYCPQKDLLASVTRMRNENNIILSDGSKGEILKKIPIESAGMTLRLSGDCSNVMLSSFAQDDKLFSIESGKIIQRFNSDAFDGSLASSADNRFWASSNIDGITTVWENESGRLYAQSRGIPAEYIDSVDFISNYNMFFSSDKYGKVKHWAIDDEILRGSLQLLKTEYSFETEVVSSNDGSVFITRNDPDNGYIQIWDFFSHRLINMIEEKNFNADNIALSPDNKLIATGGCSEESRYFCNHFHFQILSSQTGKTIAGFKVKTDNIKAVTFNADSSKLIVGGCTRTTSFRCKKPFINVYSTKDGKLLNSIPAKTTYHAFKLRVSPVDDTIVSLECGRVNDLDCVSPFLNFRSIDTGKILGSIHELNGYRGGIKYFPDGKRIAVTNSWPPITQYWSVETYKLEKTIHSGLSVSNASFSDDGKLIMTGEYDGSIKFWDAETGEHLMSVYSFVDDEWIVMGDKGNIDISENAAKHYRWRIGNCLYMPEEFNKEFLKPGLIKDLLN